MADTKIASLTELTAPDALDEFVIVDKSDTSMAGSGTDKRIKYQTVGRGELGYAEITSSFAQASAVQNTVYDITGLAITVTVGSRPIIVRAYIGAVTNSGASLNIVVRLYEGATQLQQTSRLAPATAGGGAGDASPTVRLTPSAGSHTYKASILTTSAGTPTITAVAGATLPAFIQAVEV